MEVKKQKKIKEEFLSLLLSVDFLTEEQKSEWVMTVNVMNDEEINLAYSIFKEKQSQEDDLKLNLIFNAGLGEVYKSKIKEMARKFKTKSRKKEEEYLIEKEGGTESILNKLNNI